MDRNEKGKDYVVLFEKRFLLITFIVSAILLIISLIYRNPLLAVCVIMALFTIGVTHLTNYFAYGKPNIQKNKDI